MTERRAAVILAVIAIGILLVLAGKRPGSERWWGDEATYIAMAESLAADGDLLFDGRDRERVPSGPASLILQRTPIGVTYSKPILYPLLAAPFCRLFGVSGLVVLNVLALGAALVLAAYHLRRLGDGGRALLTTVSFAFAGALMPYLVWRMFEALEVALILAGLVLTLSAERAAGAGSELRIRFLDSLAAALAGGLLLGAAASLRYPNALMGVAPVAALAIRGRFRRASAVAVAAFASFVGIGLLTQALAGEANPYKAARSSFNRLTGFPSEPSSAAMAKFDAAPATNTKGLVPRFDPTRSAYATLYFLVGRHSGMLVYLPFALALILTAVQGLDRVGLTLLASAAGLAIFYLVWMPENYFGGATVVGNRYFLPAYPALLLAIRRLPKRRHIVWPWLIAAIAAVSSIASVTATRDRDKLSQNHTKAGVFRHLPYETTAPDLDGRRDFYWSDHLVRFTDRYADSTAWGFRLSSDRPAAEAIVVKPSSGGSVRLLVLADAPTIELEVRDWGRRDRYLLTADDGLRVRRTLDVDLSSAWRHHSFWFGDGIFSAHAVRFSVSDPAGGRVSAELRYLGDDRRPLDWHYPREVIGVGLPTEARAGGTTNVPIRVRNTGRRPWRSDRLLPIHLGYRIDPVGDPAAPTREGKRVKLRNPVFAGRVLRSSIEIVWPEEPGRYRVTVDLVVEGVAWFAEAAGEPLAELDVEVRGVGE